MSRVLHVSRFSHVTCVPMPVRTLKHNNGKGERLTTANALAFVHASVLVGEGVLF